jgi:hypothetical protein
MKEHNQIFSFLVINNHKKFTKMMRQQQYNNEAMSSSVYTYPNSSMLCSDLYLDDEKQAHGRDRQTEEVANFLLSLKHSRSVSPEPREFDLCLTPTTKPVQAPSLTELSNEQNSEDVFVLSSIQSEPISPEQSPIQGSPFPSVNLNSSYDWTKLLDESPLVKYEDRDLVPDALFVAMAQMKVCHLTQSDLVGCYKSRDIGFVGMCCKHCGGQPGFGRYYPNSVRSLAQTTTSQTILKHIGGKCRYAPEAVRLAVIQLQREQAEQEGTVSGRPRYGSRKVFFQRVWIRLHGMAEGKSAIDDDMVSKISSSSHSILHSDADDRSMMSGHSDFEHQYDEGTTRKQFFNTLSLQKNKRIKVIGSTYDV